jgi:hypothetical protein
VTVSRAAAAGRVRVEWEAGFHGRGAQKGPLLFPYNGWLDEVRYQTFNPMAAGAFDPTAFLIVPVPEPATGLLLAGAATAALLRRRAYRRWTSVCYPLDTQVPGGKAGLPARVMRRKRRAAGRAWRHCSRVHDEHRAARRLAAEREARGRGGGGGVGGGLGDHLAVVVVAARAQ